jgi:hypothetical protein
MAYEILNALRAKSTIRVTGNTATTITLSQLAASPAETVTEAAIAQVSATTDGVWRVYRGDNTSGELILELLNTTHFVLYEYDISFANSATSNVHITNSGSGGTLIIQLAKTATYSPSLTGM